MNIFWWLCSPGGYPEYADSVYTDGSLHYEYVDYSLMAVRPVLKFESARIGVKDVFKFRDRWWTVIAEGIALCDTSFCRMAFRKDGNAHDANDYEKSDIKQYLDQQFERMKEGNE